MTALVPNSKPGSTAVSIHTKRAARTTVATRPLHRLNEAYDVVSERNGLVVGSVRYAFHDGAQLCIAIRLHMGMSAWGKARSEFEPFELYEGDEPWPLPKQPPAIEAEKPALTASAVAQALLEYRGESPADP